MFSWIAFIRYLDWGTIRKTIAGVIQKRLTGLAAEMAFHAVLGLFPAIVAILTAVSLFEKSLESTLIDLAIHFVDIVPVQVWTLLLEFIEDLNSAESKGWFSLSYIVAIWIISGVLSAAINALEQIHHVAPRDKRSYLQTRVVAIYLTMLTISCLILACILLWLGDFLLQIALQQSWNLFLSSVWKIVCILLTIAIIILTGATVAQFQTRLSKRNRDFRSVAIAITVTVGILLLRLVYIYGLILQNAVINSNLKIAVGYLLVSLGRIIGFPIALGLVTVAFGLIYQYGVSVRIKNTPVFPGAVLAAISWVVVSLMFRLYVLHIGIYNKIYGAVGTVVILMLWLYLSSLVMLIGEQVNVILGEASFKANCHLEKRSPSG